MASPYRETFFDNHLKAIPDRPWSKGLVLIALWITVLAVMVGLVFAIALILLPDYFNEKLRPRGCSKVGLRGKSKLDDEHDTSKSQASSDITTWKVKSLWIYPVKSCRGVELDTSKVITTGMDLDRQFCLAQLTSPFPVTTSSARKEKSAHRWDFITQRQFPLLAKVKTEIYLPDPSLPSYSASHPDVLNGGAIVLTYPFQEDGITGILRRLATALFGEMPEVSVSIPFNPTADYIREQGFEKEEMKIWKEMPKAINMGALLPPSLKYFLGVRNPLTLFRVAHKHHRQVFRNAPRQEELGYQPIIGFADAYPLHIINLASVQDVAGKIEDRTAPRLSVLQLRANIVISGPPAYAEDSWRKIKVGAFAYHVSSRTARCKLPNVDQHSGVKHAQEPDKTLRSFRCIDEGAKGSACLGMQMVPAATEGFIRVGDGLEILETGEHYYNSE